MFQWWVCDCPHPPDWHDDGFGCAASSCPCLAQWELPRPQWDDS